jgi:MarR family transcriptional regulator for hemolysin
MYSLHQTYFLVEKRLEHQLHEKKEISFSQFLILLALHCNTRTSQSQIADFLYLTEATVSRHISALEEEKLLSRKEDPTNRRKHILTMSAKGQRAFSRAHAIIEDALKELFKDIPSTERSQITCAFNRVITKLIIKPV